MRGRVGALLLRALLAGFALPVAAAPPAAAGSSTVSETDLLAQPSLEQVVAYALEHNPGILAARLEWEAARARITSQSWYENPTVSYTPDTGTMAETRAGPQGNAIEVSQAIPFPGKLTLRGRIEEARADATYQVFEATTQEISRQVRARYADYFLAARSLEVNNETTDLTRQFADIAQAKYRVGTAAQQDVILAQEQLSRLATERVVFEGDSETAIGALNALLDRPPRAPLGPPADLDAELLAVPLERLVEAADQERPELRSQDHVVDASRHSLRLARMGYLPDLRLTGQWTEVEGGTNPTFRRDGNDIWTVKLGFSIPLWLNRIAAEVDEMDARVRRERSRRRDLTNQVLDQVQRQYERIRVAARNEEIYQATLIPQTTERVAAARAGYQTGVVDFLTLIDSLRSLEEVRLERDRAVRDYQQAAADLERAVGQPLSELAP
ncbi:MAG: TolC family protein [Myxococcota bacterium]|nr:TolC family protein [Myxococcota bacterium]